MKILGIVSEYNPFHEGHAYQIKKAREVSCADYVVAIMSGHFVQRGEPAIYNPYLRSFSALNSGIDAVFMMSSRASTSSAEGFSKYGVQVLDGLGCDAISFGVENQNDDEQLKPNNILASEYKKAMKTIGSHMEIYEIERVGSGYNDDNLNSDYPSAGAIRKAVYSGAMPGGEYISPDDILPVLEATIRRLIHDGTDLTEYKDVCRELADRIRKCNFDAQTYEELVLSIKTKRYAYSRISRCLMHILLDIKENADENVYAHLIGFRKNSTELLNELKKRSKIDIISKPADYKTILYNDSFAGEVYNQLYKNKFGETLPDFFRQNRIIIL